jgi:nucleoside-diphosphate-sugar epimerase
MKSALVLGAGGFIGNHLVRRLKAAQYWVRGVDLKYPEFSQTEADEFVIGDLRDPQTCAEVLDQHFDELYQLAADMGGAGYIFSGDNDAHVMHNSATINLNIANLASLGSVGKLFYASSACVYPEFNQLDPAHPNCAEDSAYPAMPDSEYGWEKLFSERMYQSFQRNFDLNIRIARFHNVYGPENAWRNGREKAPAAICRKVNECPDGGTIEIWGDGLQTRSFLYIDDALDGLRRLMDGDFPGPVNIGSEEMLSINDFTQLVAQISGKTVHIHHIDGPMGVRGRRSDNTLARQALHWEPQVSLHTGMARTYAWVKEQMEGG